MEPEVLSWDDAGNNRCLNAGRCAWIHNPVSPYAVAIDKKLPIADDINHHSTPAGPAGRFFAPNARAYGIWKFNGSKTELRHKFDDLLPALKPAADRLGVDIENSGIVHTHQSACTVCRPRPPVSSYVARTPRSSCWMSTTLAL